MDTKFSTNRKFTRMSANILTIVAILAIAFPAAGRVSAQEPTPFLVAFPEWESVEGYGYPLNVIVRLEIDDPSTADITPDYFDESTVVETGWGGNYVKFNFGGEEGYDLKTDDLITLIYNGESLTHRARNLSITYVDVEADSIMGMADPEEEVFTNTYDDWERVVTTITSSNGEWIVNTGLNLEYNSGGRAQIYDGLGNSTAVDWSTPAPPPNPFIAVSLTEHWFWVNNFMPETIVTFSIYENQGDESPILEFSKPTDALGNLTIEGWEHIWDPEPGDYIIATDELNTKSLVLEYVTLDKFYPENDIVSGYAMPDREIGVGVGNETGEQWMNVLADETGLWVADFTKPDFEFDITGDSWAGGHVSDEDGDVTAAHNSGPPESPAWFTAFPEWDAIEGWNFPLGAVVHLAIDDPTTEGQPDYEQDETVTFTPWGSWELWVWFDFAGVYELKAGDIVTLSYGDTVLEHTVQKLSVTKVAQEDDTIKGVADPGAEVYVWPHATGQEQLVIAKSNGNARGKWNADFTGIFDLVSSECGRSEIRDEYGNRTAVDWCIPNPEIRAWLGNQRVEGYQWPVDELVSMEIYDPISGSVFIDSQQAVATEWGSFVGFDLNGWQLQSGQIITMIGSMTEKVHEILPVSITSVDVDSNTVVGSASSDGSILLCIYDGGCEPPTETFADASGSWFVNYGEELDILSGFGMDATEFDDDGDGTSFDYWVP